jgi:hypothetical protein
MVTFILISYKIKITFTLFVVMAHDVLWVAEVICCIALLFLDLALVVFSMISLSHSTESGESEN